MTRINPISDIFAGSTGKTEGPAKKKAPSVFLEAQKTNEPTGRDLQIRGEQLVREAITEASSTEVMNRASNSIANELNNQVFPNSLGELSNVANCTIEKTKNKTYVSMQKDDIFYTAIYDNKTGRVIQKCSCEKNSKEDPTPITYVYDKQGNIQGYRLTLLDIPYIPDIVSNDGLEGAVHTYATYNTAGELEYLTVDGSKLSAVISSGSMVSRTKGPTINYEKNQDGEYKVMQ